jgi:hypothetical protein
MRASRWLIVATASIAVLLCQDVDNPQQTLRQAVVGLHLLAIAVSLETPQSAEPERLLRKSIGRGSSKGGFAERTFH